MCAKKKNHSKAKQNKLVLIGSNRCHYRGKTEVNFTSIGGVSILPKFNCDAIYYTPSFIVPLVYGQKKPEQYLASLQQKARNNEEISASKILIPKPRSKSKYCSICHKNFDDYKAHIESQQHKKEFHKANFQHHISKLCQRYTHQQFCRPNQQNCQMYKEQTVKSETYPIDDNNIA